MGRAHAKRGLWGRVSATHCNIGDPSACALPFVETIVATSMDIVKE